MRFLPLMVAGAMMPLMADVHFQATPEGVDRATFLSDAFQVEAAGAHPDVRAVQVPEGASAYLELEANEAVEFVVRPKTPGKSARVLPTSAKVACQVDAQGAAHFTLEREGQYALEWDDGRTLQLFYDPVDELDDDRLAARYSFEAGVHEAGTIILGEGDMVYVDRDAVVYGAVQVRGGNGARVVGHGVIDSSHQPQWLGFADDPEMPRPVTVYRSHNPQVNGVILVGGATSAVAFYGCSEFECANVKVFGAGKESLGVDVVGSSSGAVRNSFIRSGNRGVALRGTHSMLRNYTNNVKVHNCFVWNRGGRAIGIGPETWCGHMGDLLVAECDLVCDKASAFDVWLGGPSSVGAIAANDLRVEYLANDPGTHLVRYTNMEKYEPTEDWQWDWRDGWGTGRVEDFSVRGVALSIPAGMTLPDVTICANTNSWGFSTITLRDFQLNGQKVNPLEGLPAVTNEFAVRRLRVR